MNELKEKIIVHDAVILGGGDFHGWVEVVLDSKEGCSFSSDCVCGQDRCLLKSKLALVSMALISKKIVWDDKIRESFKKAMEALAVNDDLVGEAQIWAIQGLCNMELADIGGVISKKPFSMKTGEETCWEVDRKVLWQAFKRAKDLDSNQMSNHIKKILEEVLDT